MEITFREGAAYARLVMTPDFNNLLDAAETELDKLPRVHIKTEHAFAFGFYIRKVTMPEGAIVSTKVHGVKSPFCVTKGVCVVKADGEDPQTIEAPYVGITEPGTRRIICILEDTEWITFQPVSDVALEQLINNFEVQLMIPHEGKVPYADALNRQTPERITA